MVTSHCLLQDYSLQWSACFHNLRRLTLFALRLGLRQMLLEHLGPIHSRPTMMGLTPISWRTLKQIYSPLTLDALLKVLSAVLCCKLIAVQPFPLLRLLGPNWPGQGQLDTRSCRATVLLLDITTNSVLSAHRPTYPLERLINGLWAPQTAQDTLLLSQEQRLRLNRSPTPRVLRLWPYQQDGTTCFSKIPI